MHVPIRRSLGWIPLNTGAAKWKSGQVFHNGCFFSVWDSWGLSQYKFRSANFDEDARSLSDLPDRSERKSGLRQFL